MESLGYSAFLLSAFPHPTLRRLELPLGAHGTLQAPRREGTQPAVQRPCHARRVPPLSPPSRVPMALMELEATWGCFLLEVGEVGTNDGRREDCTAPRG